MGRVTARRRISRVTTGGTEERAETLVVEEPSGNTGHGPR